MAANFLHCLTVQASLTRGMPATSVIRIVAGSYRSLNSEQFNCRAARKFSTSTTKASEAIGFIGLGNMGGHMAKNLLKHKFSVLVFDVSPEAVKAATDAGASSAKSPAEMAAKVKTIVTMLPSSPHVKEVYAGKHGIFSTLQSGSLLLDCSTIDPAVSKEMDIIATSKGAIFMDSPVSGGINAARDGILTFMVGGQAFDRAKAILSHMGRNIVQCGPIGTGQAAKICNNMLLAISMIGTAEAMHLGSKLGLDPKMLATVLNSSSGRCWSSELYNPCPGVVPGVPSGNNYEGGFGTALMAKDLGLAQSSATANLCPTPMGSLAHQIYRVMCNAGYSKKDFSSVYLFLKEQNK